MKYLKIIFFLLICSTSLLSTYAQSQGESTSTTLNKPKQAITLATVNIYKATSTQQSNDITLSFDLTNRVGVQPGVKYGVNLIKETEEGQTIVDEYVYDEVLNLAENSSLHKVVKYKAPSNLEGVYKLFISSKNTSGFPFGIAYAGEVTLVKNRNLSSLFNIETSSCFLTVEHEKSEAKYTPLQGVDISLQENLRSNCVVENTSSSSITITPIFTTRVRSNFGDIATTTGGDMSPVTFLPHEKKMVVTVLPKATLPQAYNVALMYDKISNEINYHYVIQGGSGTIQNIILDKGYYEKGQRALLSFVYSLSADSFPESRKGTSTTLTSPSFTVSIFDDTGTICAKPVTRNLKDYEVLIKLPIEIIKACSNPKADITLSDTVLGDLSHVVFETSSNQVKESLITKIIASLIVLISLVDIVLIFFILYKRIILKGSAITALILFFVGTFFSNVETVKADTFFSGLNIFYVSLDSSSYTVGQTMYISGSGQMKGCGNSTVVASIYYGIDTTAVSTLSSDTIYTDDTLGFKEVSVIAPSAGEHVVNFRGGTYLDFDISQGSIYSIPFTTKNPPVSPPSVSISFTFLEKVKSFFTDFSKEKVFALDK